MIIKFQVILHPYVIAVYYAAIVKLLAGRITLSALRTSACLSVYVSVAYMNSRLKNKCRK